MSWDEVKKQKAIDLYTESNPTAENSMDIVAEVAEQLGESVNGVRMILSKAGVYIKKDPAAKPASGTSTAKSGGTKLSKEAAQQQLTAAIEALGKEADSDIISKMTGKAAIYFVGVLSQ